MSSGGPGAGMRQAHHAPSYYAATANDTAVRPALDGNIRADVCVIGAGFTGISAALSLAERGYSVVVLEAERIGFGASGRNGGQIVNGYSRSLEVIGTRYGEPAARALGAMALEGGRIIRERIRTYAIDCDLVDGGFFAAFTDKQMNELEHEQAIWRAHGHERLRMVSRADLPAIVRSDLYVGGMIDEAGGHIHPLNLVLGEATAFEGHSGRIFEQSRVVSVDTGTTPVARTDKGSVTCSFLLVCGNAYLGTLLPQISANMMPVSSQVMATEPLDADLAAELLPANACVEDMNYILDYYRRTADNRILFGGGVVYGGADPASVEGKLRPHLARTFPGLAGARIDYAWSGSFALTLTRIPHVGRLTPTVYFSHGDSGHGVTTTHLLGRILAEAVAGQAERFDVWSRLPCYPFPGGRRLRVPLTMLGAWWYSLRDRFGL
ncbi:NAD(P)/FAD-dependent oxidoreductase [Chelatococcus reniformis]|uniref:Oxidoreductase n=1 Tax=Chelatococcus reniformis TaxID=1494448 RepID=A0A916X6N4_9HYPH|nr:FAD-binding oxidoreductase [Chelatococcus reniformis]GGC45221.1 oxidoreductase [Chelatococcus reniformis]